MLFRGLATLFCILGPVNGYCFGAGRNPKFTASPKVEQISLYGVRVSWREIVKHRECADNFVVKYWPRWSPNDYQVSDLVDKDSNYADIDVVPKTYYQFQAVAREQKGLLGGVDYNKSPVVDFKTSVNVSPPINQLPGERKRQPRPLTHDVLYDGTRNRVWGHKLEVFIIYTSFVLGGVLVVVGIAYNGVKYLMSKDCLASFRGGDDEEEDDEDDDDEIDEDAEELGVEKENNDKETQPLTVVVSNPAF